MTEFYDEMAEVALDEIRENGRQIVIRRYQTYSNAVEATVERHLLASGALDVVVLPANKTKLGPFDNQGKGGTLIDDKLRYVLAAAKGAPFEPKENDELEFDGRLWSVIGCTPLNPAGNVPLLYYIGTRLK